MPHNMGVPLESAGGPPSIRQLQELLPSVTRQAGCVALTQKHCTASAKAGVVGPAVLTLYSPTAKALLVTQPLAMYDPTAKQKQYSVSADAVVWPHRIVVWALSCWSCNGLQQGLVWSWLLLICSPTAMACHSVAATAGYINVLQGLLDLAKEYPIIDVRARGLMVAAEFGGKDGGMTPKYGVASEVTKAAMRHDMLLLTAGEQGGLRDALFQHARNI